MTHKWSSGIVDSDYWIDVGIVPCDSTYNFELLDETLTPNDYESKYYLYSY
jgi:hypothetical protein